MKLTITLLTGAAALCVSSFGDKCRSGKHVPVCGLGTGETATGEPIKSVALMAMRLRVIFLAGQMPRQPTLPVSTKTAVLMGARLSIWSKTISGTRSLPAKSPQSW